MSLQLERFQMKNKSKVFAIFRAKLAEGGGRKEKREREKGSEKEMGDCHI